MVNLYPHDNTIFPKFRIHKYSKISESIAKQYLTPLFLGYIKLRNSVSKYTFSRRIKQIFQEADAFSLHTVRDASRIQRK